MLKSSIGWTLRATALLLLSLFTWNFVAPRPLNTAMHLLDDRLITLSATQHWVRLPGGSTEVRWDVTEPSSTLEDGLNALYHRVYLNRPLVGLYDLNDPEWYTYWDVIRFDIHLWSVQSLAMIVGAGALIYVSDRLFSYAWLSKKRSVSLGSVGTIIVGFMVVTAAFLAPGQMNQVNFDETKLPVSDPIFTFNYETIRVPTGCLQVNWNTSNVDTLVLLGAERETSGTITTCDLLLDHTVILTDVTGARYEFRQFYNGPLFGGETIRFVIGCIIVSLIVPLNTWIPQLKSASLARIGIGTVTLVALLYQRYPFYSSSYFPYGTVLLLGVLIFLWRPKIVLQNPIKVMRRQKQDRALVSLFILALLVRMVIILMETSVVFSGVYIVEALNLIETGQYTSQVYPPGYSLFIAPILLLSDNPVHLATAQIFVNSVAIVPLYFLLKRLQFERASRLFACFIYAVLPSIASVSVYAMAEAIIIPLMLLVLWWMTYAVQSVKYSLLVGLVVSYMGIVRPDILPIAGLVFVVILFFSFFENGWKPTALRLGALTIGCASFVGIWGIYNILVNDSASATSRSDAITIWGGTTQYPNTEYLLLSEDLNHHGLVLEKRQPDLELPEENLIQWHHTPEAQEVYFADFNRTLSENPWLYIKNMAYRFREIVFYNDSLFVIQPSLYSGEVLRPVPFAYILEPLQIFVERFGFSLLLVATTFAIKQPLRLAVMWIPLILSIGTIGILYYEPRYVISVQIGFIIAIAVLIDRFERTKVVTERP